MNKKNKPSAIPENHMIASARVDSSQTDKHNNFHTLFDQLVRYF